MQSGYQQVHRSVKKGFQLYTKSMSHQIFVKSETAPFSFWVRLWWWFTIVLCTLFKMFRCLDIDVKIRLTDRECLYFSTSPSSPASLSLSLSQGFAFLFAQQTALKLKDRYCTPANVAKTNHPESKLGGVGCFAKRRHKINQFGLSDGLKNSTYLKYIWVKLSDWDDASKIEMIRNWSWKLTTLSKLENMKRSPSR